MSHLFRGKEVVKESKNGLEGGELSEGLRVLSEASEHLTSGRTV